MLNGKYTAFFNTLAVIFQLIYHLFRNYFKTLSVIYLTCFTILITIIVTTYKETNIMGWET